MSIFVYICGLSIILYIWCMSMIYIYLVFILRGHYMSIVSVLHTYHMAQDLGRAGFCLCVCVCVVVVGVHSCVHGCTSSVRVGW